MDGAGIYRSETARAQVLAAYDQLLDRWPVPREDLDVDTRFGTVHVLASGPAEGTPVMLLHAASMAAPSWAPTVEPLVRAGFRVFAIDHPGEANRSVLADPRRFPRNDEEVAALYGEVADVLGIDRGPVVGASAGGQRALRYALAHPRRVTRLALLGPMGLTSLGFNTALRMMLVSMRPTSRRVAATQEWALGHAPAVLDGYSDWFRLVIRAVASPPRVARPTAIPPALLDTITAPTLVVLGDHDHLVGPPDRARAHACALPTVDTHVLASSHLVAIERADEVNRFLLDHLSTDTGR
jgi:pimeloyl-ACP methyl ester carboxylesterase